MRYKHDIKDKPHGNSAETPQPMEVAAPSNRPERRTKCMTSLERVKYTLKRNFRPRAGGRARGRVAWRGGRAMAEHGENVKRACRVCLSVCRGRSAPFIGQKTPFLNRDSGTKKNRRARSPTIESEYPKATGRYLHRPDGRDGWDRRDRPDRPRPRPPPSRGW